MLPLHLGSALPSWGLLYRSAVPESKVHARLWLRFCKIQLNCTLKKENRLLQNSKFPPSLSPSCREYPQDRDGPVLGGSDFLTCTETLRSAGSTSYFSFCWAEGTETTVALTEELQTSKGQRTSLWVFAKRLSLPVTLVYTLNTRELHGWCSTALRKGTKGVHDILMASPPCW